MWVLSCAWKKRVSRGIFIQVQSATLLPDVILRTIHLKYLDSQANFNDYSNIISIDHLENLLRLLRLCSVPISPINQVLSGFLGLH